MRRPNAAVARRRRSTLRKLAFLVGAPLVLGVGILGGIVLLLAWRPAQVECALDPGLDSSRLLCSRGQASVEECLFLESVQHLATDDREASAETLRDGLAGLGVEGSTIERLVPGVQMYSLLLVDEPDDFTCRRALASQMFSGFASRYWRLWDEPEAALFFGPLTYPLSDEMVRSIEDQLPAARVERTTRLRTAFERLLGRTRTGGMFLDGAALASARVFGQLLQGSGNESTEENPVLLALAEARRGEIAKARVIVDRAVDAAPDAESKGVLLYRFGIGLANLRAFEDATLVLRACDEVLTGVDTTRAEIMRDSIPVLSNIAWVDAGVAWPSEPIGDPAVAQIVDEILTNPEADAGFAAAASVFVHRAVDSWRDDSVDTDVLDAVSDLFFQIPGIEALLEIETRPELWPEARRYWEQYFDFYWRLSHVGDDPEAFADALKNIRPHVADHRQLLVELAVLAVEARLPGRDPDAIVERTRDVLETFEARVESAHRLDRSMAAFVASMPSAHTLAFQVAAWSERPADAFDFAERARAWTFRRRLGSRSFPIDPDLAPALRQAYREIASLEEAVGQGDTTRDALDEAYLRLEILPFQHRLDDPEANRLGAAGSLNLRQIQDRLKDDQLLLQYFFVDDRDLYLFRVTRDEIELVRLAPELPDDPRFHCVVSNQGERGADPIRPEACADADELSTWLYRALIGTDEPLDAETLIIAPHGVLHRVAFAPLRHPETGRYLVEDHRLAIVPGASMLARLAESPASPEHASIQRALVLGDPSTGGGWSSLAGAEREARRVADFFGVEPWIGERATEAVLRGESSSARLVHLAAHALYDAERPRQSRLLLARDAVDDGALTVLEVEELFDLRTTRLVTLSACETGLGERSGGDEIIGLTRAFLVAGSRAVLSTLWQVDDAASAELMIDFYEHLAAGVPAAEALRRAQLVRLADPDTRAPYYWAGYTLTGSPELVLDDSARPQ